MGIQKPYQSQLDAAFCFRLGLQFIQLTLELMSTSAPSQNPLRREESLNKTNTEAVLLHVYAHEFLIDSVTQLTGFKSRLRINRASGKTEPRSKQEPIESPQKSAAYSMYLGILPIFNKRFLVFAETVREVCVIDASPIYQISSLGYVALGNQKEYSLDPQWKTIVDYMSFLSTNFMSQGHYFSYSYDLSISKIRYAQGYPFNFKFCWNSHLGYDLIEFGWFTPVIQGFVGILVTDLKGSQFKYYLISRRSWKKGGTRYNARGVGRKGNVANFVQTQQLVYYNGYCCSHVQIRGSVPLFFKQSGVYATVQIIQSREQNRNAFLTHYMKLVNSYNLVMNVNLLSSHKPQEHQLTLYIEELLKEKTNDKVKYEYFDFHEVCKNQRFDKAILILQKLGPINQVFGFYAQELSTHKVLETQKGVMRTNCLDCLDRTNFVQTKLAMQILDKILKRLGIDLKTDIGYSDLESALDDLESTVSFVIGLRHIWADNGDMISIHYTGTPSTHTNILRSGKRDLMGSVAHTFVSLNRFYKQNVTDNYKQQVIDLLLGDHVQTANYNQLQNRLKSICEY